MFILFTLLLEVQVIKLYIAKHVAEAHLVRGLLQGEGIAAKVCDDGSLSQVWLLKDPELAHALVTLARYTLDEDESWTGSLVKAQSLPECG